MSSEEQQQQQQQETEEDQQQRALHYPLGSNERFHEDQRMTRARQEELKRQRTHKHKEECPFTPSVSDTASTLAARSSDVITRLQQSDINRRQRLEEALKRAEQAKLRGLTFKPEINQVSAKVHSAHQQQCETSGGGGGGGAILSSHNNRDLLSNMKVEQRLMMEGKFAAERRERMRADLEKQERARLDVIAPRSSSAHNASSDAASAHVDDSSFFERMHEAERAAKENKERLRHYLERQHTFRPSINQVSAATVSMMHEEEKKKKNNAPHDGEAAGGDDGADESGCADCGGDGSVVSRLHDKSVKDRSQRQREREQQQARQHSRQYTFAPRVGLRSAQLAVRRAVSQGGGNFAQRQQQAEEARQQHLQVIRDAQRAKERKEQHPPMVVRTNGRAVPTGSSTGRQHLDASEMSDHVRRMESTAQQRAVRLRELAERTTAIQCPFQPTTSRRSAELVAKKFADCNGDVVQRMEHERRMSEQRAAAASVERSRKQQEEEQELLSRRNLHRHENHSYPRAGSASIPRRGGSIDSSIASSAVPTEQERMYEFFEHQDDHVRRREAYVSEMRQRLEQEKMAKCTFQPRINQHSAALQQQHQQSPGGGGAGGSSSSLDRSSSAAPATAGRSLDEQVRGIGSVRARVALAARLKAEQAEREARAFGLRSQHSSSGGGGGGGVNISVSLDPTTSSSSTPGAGGGRRSNSAPRSDIRGGTPRRRSNSAGSNSSNVDNSIQAVRTRPSSAGPQRSPVVAVSGGTPSRRQPQQRGQQQQSPAVQLSLQRGREKLFNGGRQQQQQQQQQKDVLEEDFPEQDCDDDDDDDPPTEGAPQQHQQHHQRSHPYVPPPDSPNTSGNKNGATTVRQRLTSEVMRGAGLLPPQLLAEYEQEWMQQQKQQHHHDEAPPAPAAASTSTPRMKLVKKRGDGVAHLGTTLIDPQQMQTYPQEEQYQKQQRSQIPRTGSMASGSKKCAVFDLALRRHLASDAKQ